MIRFDRATKRYPDGTTAVDELDLEAPSGQITVLVGPSGCGKTTSLRMINRMIEPTSGTIWLDETDTASMPAHELRRQIGYVIQHAGLFPHRTIVDNIATVPLLLGTDKKQARSRAMELIERVGLDPAFAKRYPAQLSGGQQQRVGVARALAADPPVMLMDEPFSAVDPVVREQLQEEFLRLQDELGKTIVFVTHDIDEAIKLGDQVAVLRVGGTLAQLADAARAAVASGGRLRRGLRGPRPGLPGAGVRRLRVAADARGTHRHARRLRSGRDRGRPVRARRQRPTRAPGLAGPGRAVRADGGDGGDGPPRRDAGHPGRHPSGGAGRLPVLPVRSGGRGRRGRSAARHPHRARGARPDRVRARRGAAPVASP